MARVTYFLPEPQPIAYVAMPPMNPAFVELVNAYRLRDQFFRSMMTGEFMSQSVEFMSQSVIDRKHEPPAKQEPISLDELREQCHDGAATADGARKATVKFDAEGGFSEN